MCTVRVAATESAMLHMALKPLFRACPDHEARFDFDKVEFPSVVAFQAAMNYLLWQGFPDLANLFVREMKARMP